MGVSGRKAGIRVDARQQTEWRGLTIASENRCSPYDSDDYSYPQSVEDDIVRQLGGIFSPYTCESFDSTRETDIEHMIARSEAHDSGLCAADAGTRRQFARDLLNLTLASPSLNRSAEERQGRGGMDAGPEPLLVRANDRGCPTQVPVVHRPPGGRCHRPGAVKLLVNHDLLQHHPASSRQPSADPGIPELRCHARNRVEPRSEPKRGNLLGCVGRCREANVRTEYGARPRQGRTRLRVTRPRANAKSKSQFTQTGSLY